MHITLHRHHHYHHFHTVLGGILCNAPFARTHTHSLPSRSRAHTRSPEAGHTTPARFGPLLRTWPSSPVAHLRRDQTSVYTGMYCHCSMRCPCHTHTHTHTHTRPPRSALTWEKKKTTKCPTHMLSLNQFRGIFFFSSLATARDTKNLGVGRGGGYEIGNRPVPPYVRALLTCSGSQP